MKLIEALHESHMEDIPKGTVVGIDIGSRQSKAVLLHKGELFTALVPTGFFMKETAEELLQSLYQQSGIGFSDIEYIVNTGYGRVALEFDEVPNRVVTEIACHGMGAHFLGENISTIIDIGGQDSKVIKIDVNTGKVLDFAMNDKCAAGTGRFLERIAKVLGLDVKEIGPISLQADDSLDVSAQCIVFAESEVVSERAKGTSVENIAAGIHNSVARRVYSLLNRVGIEQNVIFTGGVSNNVGVRKAFEDLLGFPIETSKLDTVYAGALGAAVLAGQFAESKTAESGTSVDSFHLDISSLETAVENEKELIIKRKTGKKKNVAYVCAYMPIEILEAANVSHYRIMDAGNQDEIMAGESITQSVFCDLTKSVLGGFITEKPIIASLDHLYTFFTCDCMRKTVEAVNNTYLPATIYNLPRLLEDKTTREYYLTELQNFKKDLEELTGEPISQEDIGKNIDLYNQAKQSLREISAYRKKEHPLLTGSQFQKIARSYYYLPVQTLNAELKKILEQLENAPESNGPGKPRLMISGGVLADGDHKITDILEELETDIVVEDNCTGLKPFLHDVSNTGNWVEDIADGYLHQAPCARMKPIEKVIENSVHLAKEYAVDGVVFYYLKFCPCYSMIIRKYVDAFNVLGIPVLVMTSDYSQGDEGQLKIRAEAFIEMIRNGGQK